MPGDLIAGSPAHELLGNHGQQHQAGLASPFQGRVRHELHSSAFPSQASPFLLSFAGLLEGSSGLGGSCPELLMPSAAPRLGNGALMSSLHGLFLLMRAFTLQRGCSHKQEGGGNPMGTSEPWMPKMLHCRLF